MGFGEGSTQGLDNTIIAVEPKYSVNFTQSRKICTIMEAAAGSYLLILQKYINS